VRPSFHPAASFFGYYNGTLLAGPAQALFDWVDRNGPAIGTKTQFGQIDIRETTALVRLEMDGVSGNLSLGGNARLSDFFTLLKVDGRWMITHKTFHWY
jgi:Putative lumazine-binding